MPTLLVPASSQGSPTPRPGPWWGWGGALASPPSLAPYTWPLIPRRWESCLWPRSGPLCYPGAASEAPDSLRWTPEGPGPPREAGRGGRGPIHISWAGLGHRIPLPPQGTWWGWHRPWAGGSGRLLRGPLPGGSGPPSPALPLSGISLCSLGLPAVSETPGKENRSAGERKVARAPSAPGVGSSELGCTASYHLQGRRDTACGLLVEGHPPRP